MAQIFEEFVAGLYDAIGFIETMGIDATEIGSKFDTLTAFFLRIGCGFIKEPLSDTFTAVFRVDDEFLDDAYSAVMMQFLVHL